jgi:gluconate 2-dehydrogenase subunit 3-like protein
VTRVSRRGAIKTLGAAVAAVPVLRVPHDDLDPAILSAIAEVVLPSEADRAAAVASFTDWISNYTEGADTDHGYGNTRIRATGPSPGRSYPAQIEKLEAAARAQGASSFAAAPPGVRRAIVEAAIADAKVDRLPSRPTGGHIATDLMGHYFASPAAQNLCYRAAIDRDACRGLPGSEQAPARLASRTSRLPPRPSRT